MRFLTPILPAYPGPFTVGSVEVEIPAPWPAEYSAIETAVETLQFRIFYPANVQDPAKEKNPFWFPEGRREYLKNYVTFSGRSSMLASVISRIPFVTDVTLPCLSNVPLLEPPKDHKWPIVMFSHGLGGTRNAYSQFCGSLASHGHIVVAPEHRDKSAPVSYVRDFSAQTNLRKEVKYQRMTEISEAARILRTYQLVQRVREIVSIVKVLLENNIELVPIGETSPIEFNWSFVETRREKVLYAGHSFGAATAVVLVKGVYRLLEFLHLNESDVTASNSTGSEEIVTSVTLDGPIDRTDEFLRPHPSPAILLLDPWCIPIYQTMGIPLTVPTIVIMSQVFHAWSANMSLVYQLLSNSGCLPATPPPPKVHLFLTKPSAHHSQSDLALLFPSLTKYAFKVPECTFETQTAVMSMNVAGCVEFLRENGIDSFDVTDEREGLVKTQSMEQAKDDPTAVVLQGYLVADNKVKGWSRLNVRDDITVVDILAG
ncbi:platelet-activating factor acetylhydrolase [Lipomyces kononenkoae]|uniref:Platelet-activating factor acetylhydrolase n=1 Tax=Lipomyces kononenkoae TaxID=34357 RepID=A0ACC3T3Y1_LIPKO